MGIGEHFEGVKQHWASNFAFLDYFKKVYGRDQPLPKWSEADVDEFIASDPVYGPQLKALRESRKFALGGALVGAAHLGGVAVKYSKSPHERTPKKAKLQSKPSCTSSSPPSMAPMVARRRSYSPKTPWNESIPRADGKPPNASHEGPHRRTPSKSNRAAAASSTTSKARSATEPRHPARGSRGRKLHRAASPTMVVDRRRNSTERRRRDGDPPPAKPEQLRLRRQNAAAWRPLAYLHYVHSANRRSPVLPPPERPAEGEEAADSAPARWKALVRPKNASLATVDGGGAVQGVVLATGFGALTGAVLGSEVAEHWYQLYKMDKQGANLRFIYWWEDKVAGQKN